MIFKRLFFFFLAFICMIAVVHGKAKKKNLINGSGQKMYIDAHNNISETRAQGVSVALVFGHINGASIDGKSYNFEQGNPENSYYNSVALLCGNIMATHDQQVAINAFCNNYTPLPTDLDTVDDYISLFVEQINLFACQQKNCVYLLDAYGQKVAINKNHELVITSEEDQEVITLQSVQGRNENNDCSIVLLCGNRVATQVEQAAITHFVLYNKQKNVFFYKQLKLMQTGLNFYQDMLLELMKLMPFLYQSTPYTFSEDKKPLFRKKSCLSQVELAQAELE